MTVSIRKISLGAGYRYLMSSVARGDGAEPASSPLTRYYAESGTQPGRFLGAGLAGLAGGQGVRAGSMVTEEHLFRMLGMLQDPITGEQLGRPPRVTGPTRIDRFGRAGKPAGPVAGFDLTFSAPKSVSVAWAVGDPATQAAIYEAHLAAVEYVIGYGERAVFSSRSGDGGVVQEDIRGVVAAGFDHWDSRAGDPQLHTHVVVMNRVQCGDGVWRTLDGRVLFRATVALSEMYNAVLSDYLTSALGWGWEPMTRTHSDVPKYEVAGVSAALQAEFSRRSGAIEDAKNALVDQFVFSRGRQPSNREVLKLRQQATLATRTGKEHHLLGEQMAAWRARAAAGLGGPDPTGWVSTLAGRNHLPLLVSGDLDEPMLADVAGVALGEVAGKRATFSRMNVFAEVLRQFHGVRFATPDQRVAVVEATTQRALAAALLISPPQIAHTPAMFCRSDGTSRFQFRGLETYTTRQTLDAEARLLEAGRSLDGPGVHTDSATVATGQAPGGQRLSPGQDQVVQDVVGSGRVLDLLVGAAGTGKSTTMAGVRQVWEQHYGPGSVIGLAPSAAAADVLSHVVGIPTENTAKWLAENARNTLRHEQIKALQERLRRASPSLHTRAKTDKLRALIQEFQQWSLSPGQLVIVDEASMAGTFDLDTLTTQARQAGAKVLLVGDWAQLSPVATGGAFSLLVNDRGDAPELLDVRRFAHEWERAASLQLRNGHVDVIDTYDSNGRISGGDREAMLDALYSAWHADIAAGRRSLMIADDNFTVRDLNARAQADRVATGQVQDGCVDLADGATAGVGDLVVTRRNDRTLATGSGWVKNGDTWTIMGIDRDGALTVRRSGGGGSTHLPPEYCRQHVELGYATTAHRAQGQTVDSAHAFVAATTQREPLYVMATRGRESNRLYVDTVQDPDPETVHDGADDLDGIDVLRRVLATSGNEKSATETIADQWAHAHSASTQSAEYVTIARALEHGGRYAEHDSDVERALADRAQLIRQAAASRLSSRAVPAPFVPFDDAPTRAMAGPEI